MTYRRLSDFDVTNPEELRRDLQQMDREVDQALKDLPRQPFDTVRRTNVSTSAKLGELLVVDTSRASVTITLPQVSSLKDRRLQSLGIAMTSASNTCTVQCVGGDTLDRQSSQALTGFVGLSAYIIFDGLEYWM